MKPQIINCPDIYKYNTIKPKWKQSKITCKLSELYENFLQFLLKYIYFQIINTYKLKYEQTANFKTLPILLIKIEDDLKYFLTNSNEVDCLKAHIIDIKEDILLEHTINNTVGLARLLPSKIKKNEKVKYNGAISTSLAILANIIMVNLNALQKSVTIDLTFQLKTPSSMRNYVVDNFKVKIDKVEFGISINELLRIKIASNEKLVQKCSFKVECDKISTRTFNELDNILLGDLDPKVLYQV